MKDTHKVAVGGIAFVAASWAVIVYLSGSGWNPTDTNWNFENTGQLGDSFGVVSAFMSGLAAYFAFAAYRAARDDIERSTRQAVESTFLNLLERRHDVLNHVRTTDPTWDGASIKVENCTGQHALDLVVSRLSQPDTYIKSIQSTPGLPSLFRFTYHLIVFAHEQFSDGNPVSKSNKAYKYIRLLRAQMSESELILLSINCSLGYGKEKFKKYAEDYALFHNMDVENINRFDLWDYFNPQAFGLLPEDRPSRPIRNIAVSAASGTGIEV